MSSSSGTPHDTVLLGADGLYTGAAAGYASAMVASAAVVFVVNEELGRDLGLLDLGDVPLTVYAVQGLRRGRCTRD